MITNPHQWSSYDLALAGGSVTRHVPINDTSRRPAGTRGCGPTVILVKTISCQ